MTHLHPLLRVFKKKNDTNNLLHTYCAPGPAQIGLNSHFGAVGAIITLFDRQEKTQRSDLPRTAQLGADGARTPAQICVTEPMLFPMYPSGGWAAASMSEVASGEP